MYKKVYVEITNNCNLNCEFCPHNKRKPKFISLDEFNTILDKLEGYTKYLYFHVLGEPLLHPNINELIDIASKRYNINITTNGYLIDKIKGNHNIRQVNISLHSFNDKYSSLEDYLNKILPIIDELSSDTFISLRLWTNNKHSLEMLKIINEYFGTNITEVCNYTIRKNIYLDIDDEFIWPNLNNNLNEEVGTCYALKDQIAILVDGTIVPCCLDSEGIIKLGNIYENTLEDVINSNRYQFMLEGFKHNKKCEELCKHCKFNKVKK